MVYHQLDAQARERSNGSDAGRAGGQQAKHVLIWPATRTHGRGRSELPVLLSARESYGSHGDAELMVGLTVRLQAPGAQYDTVAAVADGCDALVATGIMPAGAWP